MPVILFASKSAASVMDDPISVAGTAMPSVWGTQRVLTGLRIDVGSVVELVPWTFNAPGTYTVFDYAGASLELGVVGGDSIQSNLDQCLTFDDSELAVLGLRVSDPHGTIDPVAQKITVTIVSI